MDISRRNFLKTSALGALTVAAGASVAESLVAQGVFGEDHFTIPAGSVHEMYVANPGVQVFMTEKFFEIENVRTGEKTYSRPAAMTKGDAGEFWATPAHNEQHARIEAGGQKIRIRTKQKILFGADGRWVNKEG